VTVSISDVGVIDGAIELFRLSYERARRAERLQRARATGSRSGG
jgi:hypothetical protein